MNKAFPIVIAGAGSIGERHITVLQSLGYQNLWIWRQRNLPLRTVDEHSVQVFQDRDDIRFIKPKAAIVCTPTAHHIDFALYCAELSIHLLIEKPLSHTLEGLDILKPLIVRNQLVVQVGYMLRFHPFFIQLKKEIASGRYGKVLSLQSYWGEYLPDWHPWENFRESYAALKELGGGAALTLSHDIDIISYLAGSNIRRWNTEKNYKVFDTLNVESAADISLVFENGATAHCHLNFHEKAPKRWYRVVMEHASFEIDYLSNTFTIHADRTSPKTTTLAAFHRNEMFEAQALHFFRSVESSDRVPSSLQNVTESEMIIRICS